MVFHTIQIQHGISKHNQIITMADIIVAPSHSLGSNALNDLMHECNKNHGHNLLTKFNGLPHISNPLWHSKQPNQGANIIAKCQKTHSPSNCST
jgi:hypothetical protein